MMLLVVLVVQSGKPMESKANELSYLQKLV